MKDILFKELTCLTPDGIEKGVNLLIKDDKFEKVQLILDESEYNIVSGEDYIAVPLFPLFKSDIFDIISYKYLNEIDKNFKMDKEKFEKLPFDFLEKSSEIAAKKMVDSGSGFLFYSHLSYQMVKNSLLTISTNLYKKFKLKSSLSYFKNSYFPEQKILSEKENEEFKSYCENSNDDYRYYHKSAIIDEEFNDDEIESINHYYIKKGFLSKIEPLISKSDSSNIFIIQFEDFEEMKNFTPKFNTFIAVDEDLFLNKNYADFVFNAVDEDIDHSFILFTGYGVYNIFNSLGNIYKNSSDIRSIEFIKNQMKILSKMPEFFTATKTGIIAEEYFANMMLIKREGFPIEDMDQFIDFLIIFYFENSLPSKVYVRGKEIR